MSESKHTPGVWEFTIYGLPSELIEQQRKLGIEPTRVLSNDGAATIMGGADEDRRPVARAECQVAFKRGQGHKSECAERDANARLIAAAPELLQVLERALKESNCPGENCVIDWHAQAQVVIAKARGE